MGELDGRVDAALGLEAGVRGAAGDVDVVDRRRPCGRVLSAPPSAEASSTSTAARTGASASISAREVVEPTSSSPVTSRVTPSRDGRSGDGVAAPSPDRTSCRSEPGPRSTPSAIVNGCVRERCRAATPCRGARAPAPFVSPPKRHRRWRHAVDDDALRLGAEQRGVRCPATTSAERRDRRVVRRRRLAFDERPDVGEHRRTRPPARARQRWSCVDALRGGARAEVDVLLAGRERVERDRHPRLALVRRDREGSGPR